MNMDPRATPSNVLNAHNELTLRGLPALANESVISTFGEYLYPLAHQLRTRAFLVHALRKAVSTAAPWITVRPMGTSFEVILSNAPKGEPVIPADLESFLIAVTLYTPMPDKAPTILIEDQRKELYSASILLDGTIMVTPMSMGKVLDQFTAENMNAVFTTITDNAIAVRKSSLLHRILGRR